LGHEGDVARREEQALAYIGGRARGPSIAMHCPDPVARFIEQARLMSSTLDEVDDLARVPEAVGRYLRELGAPMRIACWSELAPLDWQAASIEAEARPSRDGDATGVTSALCAIAETGTLMLASGPATPGKTSLLPDNHLAVLRKARIVPTMEDAWALARQALAPMPRAVSFISGPSRTADIEQTLVLGAHGPYRVHIILIP
jgi:L-lactate dehydrogenase complex protein LldG